MEEKIVISRLGWFGHVWRRHVVRRSINSVVRRVLYGG
jgi:hypothetical protein